MKKIVMLKSSPRKNGNSSTLAAALSDELKISGASVVEYDVATLNIDACRACDACSKIGKCIIRDDFDKVAKDLCEADGIVISSPIYWYTFPAKIKTLIDRFYALYRTGNSFSGKKVALLSTCADAEEETFTGIRFAFEQTMGLMNADIVGEVLISGVSGAGDIKNTDGEKKARKLAATLLG